MNRCRYILGLVFFALALSFAFTPAEWTPPSYANQEIEGGDGSGDAGGKESGDPDMPDTGPPPGDGSQSGSYGGPYGGMGSVFQTPDAGAGTGWSSRSESRLWLWLRTTWQVLRVQFGWV